jgi:hypothetical protein
MFTDSPTVHDSSDAAITQTVGNDRALGSQPDARETTIAQLFRRQPGQTTQAPPPGCGPQGCQLSIDQTVLTTGQVIKARYQGKDAQVLNSGESRAIVLNLVEPVLGRTGQVVVPRGSEIRGDVVPVQGGGQFIAQQIIVNGKPYNLAAQSGTIHDVKDPRETSVGAIAGDVVIGAAGGAVVSQVLKGRIDIGEVVAGAAAGAIIGNVTAPQAVVISQNDQFDLQVTSDFKLQ